MAVVTHGRADRRAAPSPRISIISRGCQIRRCLQIRQPKPNTPTRINRLLMVGGVASSQTPTTHPVHPLQTREAGRDRLLSWEVISIGLSFSLSRDRLSRCDDVVSRYPGCPVMSFFPPSLLPHIPSPRLSRRNRARRVPLTQNSELLAHSKSYVRSTLNVLPQDMHNPNLCAEANLESLHIWNARLRCCSLSHHHTCRMHTISDRRFFTLRPWLSSTSSYSRT